MRNTTLAFHVLLVFSHVHNYLHKIYLMEQVKTTIRSVLLLYKASISGNIAAAKVILGKRPELVRFSITESYETVLQIAVLGESPALVDYLVSIMSKDDLEIPNINGETALHIAATTGNTEIATILIRENNNLLDIPDRDGKTPIHIAALCRKHDMVDFLYKESQQMTGEFWTDENRGLVLMKCIEANLFDVALQMVTKHPVLATNGSVLRLLACKPHDFQVLRPGIISWLLNSFFRICPWKIQFPDKESDSDALQLLRFILKEIGKLPEDELVAIFKGPPDETKEDEKKPPSYEKETQEALHLLRTISENIAKMPAQIFSLFKNSANNKTTALNDGNRKYSSRVVFLAAEMGNTTFIAEVIRQYPHLVREVNDDNQSIFHVAVSYGHVGVYKLLNELGSSSKDLIIALEDKDGNNMLHLVGEKAKGDRVKNVRGVGMQLNSEISWFKEIETIIPPRLQEKKNAAGLTPHQVFIKNHRDLFSKGEDWMKEIATQLMVVAALVATTSYQVAFQLPGGYDDEAQPKLIRFDLFRMFFISDALSFIASTTAILMVLSILRSNYDEYDFMISLSKQLDICLIFVFISITSMIITFLINFFLMFTYEREWFLPNLISVFAVTPFVIFIFSFIFSNYHLWSRIKCSFKMLYTTRKSRMN